MSSAVFPHASETSPAGAPSEFAGKHVIVMGLGHFGGGLGAARWLASRGAHVTVTDAAPAEKLAESVAALAGLPITFKLGGHDPADLRGADLLVINPAVDRAKSAFVQAAIQAHVPLTTEMNLFLQRCRAITVGITGSVGKSTTTALIFEALKAALGQPSDASDTRPDNAPAAPPAKIENQKSKTERPGAPAVENPQVFLGGNIGRSLLFDLPHILPTDVVVLELSSFMLDETPAIAWSPHIAVVTNIFPNHLDRHRTLAAYTAAKQNILRFQKPDDIAILNNDHDLVARWTHLARGKVVKFTIRGPWAGHGLSHLPLAMPGAHNQSNAAAALAVLNSLPELPLDFAAARAAIETFPGLAHRLQHVHTLTWTDTSGHPHPLAFYNDSKATTPDASITAVQAFEPRTAIFIIGGYDKKLKPEAFDPFHQLLAERALGVLGIGQTGAALVGQVEARAAAHGTPVKTRYAGTLENALTFAIQWARTAGARAIVLSPASASWDQFPNYEKRGDAFTELSRNFH